VIPNIVKGRGISGALRYATGEGNDPATGKRLGLVPGETSRAEILGGQGFGFDIDTPERLELARRIMEWQAAPENQASRTKPCVKDCLHMSLSWEGHQAPSKAEMIEAAESALKALGMENARAVFVAHNDTDHKHVHIVASRINPETGRTYSDTRDKTRAQAWAIQWERERGQVPEARKEMHRLADCVRARDAEGLLARLTDRQSTFTAKELDKALAYGGLTDDARSAFRAEILSRADVIGLRETADAEVTRYTTRDILSAEREIQRDTHALANVIGHGVMPHTISRVRRAHQLNAEQAKAFEHATGEGGFAIIAGEAGTGKSRTLAAIRDAYESEGMKVVGMSWTNAVVQDMRRDGFKTATTIAAELKRIESGTSQWDRHTVLMIDEAAMLSTQTLADLTEGARTAGAKLILCGDDRQLASIERGGMFGPLKNEFGAAELRQVQRVRDIDQRAAFNAMHEGQFKPALDTFDKQGAIHWTATQIEAVRALGERYTRDCAASPDKSRFIFAYTNDQVRVLNSFARDLASKQGKLGAETILPTADGPTAFAEGDRIQFTGNGRTRRGKDAGLVNGAVGTVLAIDTGGGKPRVTVALDGQAKREVTFTVGDVKEKGEFNTIRHGYAGTIYKGQGRTLDQTYVFHSSQWRSASSYVALTRHRDSVAIFAARETATDLDALARQMGRDESKSAASGFVLDPASYLRSGLAFGDAALEIGKPQGEPFHKRDLEPDRGDGFSR
jgi:DNA transposition AAA+ family ATPase